MSEFDPGVAIDAAHRYATWAEEARRLWAAYKERFKLAHPWPAAEPFEEVEREPLCCERMVGPDRWPEDRWCQGCVEASALRDQWKHAVRMRTAAGLRIERAFGVEFRRRREHRP